MNCLQLILSVVIFLLILLLIYKLNTNCEKMTVSDDLTSGRTGRYSVLSGYHGLDQNERYSRSVPRVFDDQSSGAAGYLAELS